MRSNQKADPLGLPFMFREKVTEWNLCPGYNKQNKPG